MGFMIRRNFVKEFRYTNQRMKRIVSHELNPENGFVSNGFMYFLWQESAGKQLGKLEGRLHEVKRLPFGFCYIPTKLKRDMKIFRDVDARYAHHYFPSIDRTDPSVAF